MAKERKERKEDEKGLLYLKTDSINDVCRYVYNFDFTSSNLLLSTGTNKRLIALYRYERNSMNAYSGSNIIGESTTPLPIAL